MKHIHFIAIGGAAMHALAIDLHNSGYTITGSDDEIYEPSKSRLAALGILPEKLGWFADKVTHADAIVLGMHAKPDNPELLNAQNLGIPVFSYPEFVYLQSIKKTRVVVAGSHGKTTTTAMILHVLKKHGIMFDYLLGASVPGFDNMVKLSDAPLIIIEGDEYLSSPIDRKPKIHHYHPHISVITGIAWDHINVFPTFETYIDQFRQYIKMIHSKGTLFYNREDNELQKLVSEFSGEINVIPYTHFERGTGNNILFKKSFYPISVIGTHNLSNLQAAQMVCDQLGIGYKQFFEAVADFKGASRRLQVLYSNPDRTVYLDFAHAPSKVQATCGAVKDWHGNKKLLAVLELHTFSSLNRDFFPQYNNTLSKADKCVIFFNEHTLRMKNMPMLDIGFLKENIGHHDCQVFSDNGILKTYLENSDLLDYNVLLMSSGNFNGLDLGFLSI